MFEIRVARTNELLHDNLTEEDAVEMLYLYRDICGYDAYMVRSNRYGARCTRSEEAEYKEEYIQLFAELQMLGNLI